MFAGCFPFKTLITSSATVTAILYRASFVGAAICGVTMTFSVARSAASLSKQDAVISYFMTNIMFAALREMCGVKAELKELITDELPDKRHGTELWIITAN